jgi:hypothetical protein
LEKKDGRKEDVFCIVARFADKQKKKTRTQGNDIDQYEGMIVLFFQDADLADLGTANVNGAVLGSRDAIATGQARDGDLAPLVDMAVPYRGPCQPQNLEPPTL